MSGTISFRVDGIHIPQAFRGTARERAGHDAVIFPELGLRWTYEEYERRAVVVARALIALGVKPGEHVGIWCANRPEWLLVQFGTALAGAVLVNINPANRAHEAEHVIGHSDIVALFLSDAFRSCNHEAILAELVPELMSSAATDDLNAGRFPHLRRFVSLVDRPSPPGLLPWGEFLGLAESIPESSLEPIAAALDPDSPVNIQYTSGTTGRSKGAVLSHRNLLVNALLLGEGMRFMPEDRLCLTLPFYHCFGCVVGNLLSVVFGSTLVVPAESFDPEKTLRAVEAERCTALYGVPTMFSAELHHPNFAKFDLHSLRTGIMAGSLCPEPLMRRVMSEMRMRELICAYGLTECSPAVTLTGLDEPAEIRAATVGRPIPGVEVRILDPETLEDVPPGQSGELAARGHNVMLGYYKMPEATAQTIIEGGWLRTGDMARLSESGDYQITGRIKDMIIRGGENIYPREIEDVLLTHPAILDAQVVGLPDEFYGEQVAAWIVLKELGSLTQDEIRAFCKTRIASYKAPHYVVFVREFPLTANGKVQKFKLREMGIEMFGLRAAAGSGAAAVAPGGEGV